MAPVTTFADDVITHLRWLWNLAMSLAGEKSLADDLLQETVLRALVHADQFKPGTDLRAWLAAILRNAYFSEQRRRWRLFLLDAAKSGNERIENEQDWHLQMRDLTLAFAKLAVIEREAIMLVGANGYSYDHAAKLAGCSKSAMGSRVSRARARLRQMLGNEGISIASDSVDFIRPNKPE